MLNIIVLSTVLSTSLLNGGHAAKCMSPSDARFLVPMQRVPEEWKATRRWHTGDYFPSADVAEGGEFLLTSKVNAARIWWVKDGESDFYRILTQDENNDPRILCTLFWAGLQLGWQPNTPEAKRNGYCQWVITVPRNNSSLFQMRNYELSESSPELGPVYLNKTGLYFNYDSNSLNDPLNRVEESLTWWKWERDESIHEMVEMSALPDECGPDDSGLMGRSIGGNSNARFTFTSGAKFARCGDGWYLHKTKCYRIFAGPGLTRRRTEKVCKRIGGRIALPETGSENQYIRALATTYVPRRRFWIRAMIVGVADRFQPSDFKDNGKSLLFRRFRTRRFFRFQKCAQVVPGLRGRNWIAKRCGANALVLCERDAVITELPGSLRCGRIQFPQVDSLMNDIYRAGDQAVRIVNGEGAKQGQLPWQASLRFKELQEIDGFAIAHYCGAVLIDTRWALSAAHCFYERDPSDFYVRLGDLYNELDEGREQDFDIERLFMHEQYVNQPSHRNDIALIRLNGTATFNFYVQPACLPTREFRIRSEGERCQVSGWGVTDLAKGQSSAPDLLQYVTVPTMPDSVCSERYNKRRQYFVKKLMFCAGYRKGGKDSCSGDSGGPYVCRNIDGRYAVAGIVSFGIGCAHEVYPGVYANVRHYVPWIVAKIRANGKGDIIS